MTNSPQVARTRAELDASLHALRQTAARDGRPVVLVPTMGALHDGHRALLRQAVTAGRTAVVSVFVNPLQFGSAADLARYPRALAADVATCAEEGVALVWAPDVEQMYPGGVPVVTVSAGALGTVLEGHSRPGHFDGVLTVVSKLFHQVRPDVAVFGAKDAQQLTLVRRMVADLDFGVVIESVATVRDRDGLALSSRNSRLSPDGRRTALALSRSLRAVAGAGALGAQGALAAGREVLDGEPDLVLDYFTLVDPETFAELAPSWDGPALAVLAAEVEGTRLLDNAPVFVGSSGGGS